jgi:hypothetical protein
MFSRASSDLPAGDGSSTLWSGICRWQRRTIRLRDRQRCEISSRADQRTCIPRRGTYDLNTDKGEVGGSSPPRPTIQVTNKYAAILTFPLFGDLPLETDLPTICQLLEQPNNHTAGLPATVIGSGVRFSQTGKPSCRRAAEREGYVSTRTLRVFQCSAALKHMGGGSTQW